MLILILIPLIATSWFHLLHKDLKMTKDFFIVYTVIYTLLLGLVGLINVTIHYILGKGL